MSIVTSIIGTFFVRLGASSNIMGALYKGVIATVLLSLIGLWPLTELSDRHGHGRSRAATRPIPA